MRADYHYCQHAEEISAMHRDLSHLEAKVAQLEAENREARKAMFKMAERLIKAKLLDAGDSRWISELLGDHASAPGEGLERAAARAAHRVIGKVRCQCGATVDDIEGVQDERCPWCGERLRTER